MDFDREELLEGSNPKEALLAMVNQELSQGKRRLQEIKDQITAMQTSVDREQNRYSNIASELRTIKDNLDTVPREDIRDKYDEALDVRFRLATMRGQLEKFESSYDLFEQRQNLLQQIATRIQGADFSDTGGGSSVTDTQMNLDVAGIIRAQEEERLRLSRALHDGPAQSLTNFILQAEICQRLFNRDPEMAAAELGNLKTNASSTFQKVRDFIFDLRPMMLDDLGVGPTVRRYVEQFGDKNDIDTKLELANEGRRLGEKIREVMIFRGIQDAMTMARDYSAPTEIQVRLDLSTERIRIVVQDNGRGFDDTHIFDGSGDSDARIQALNMLKGKFELAGGTIEVKSSENEGTTVRLELPSGE